ncbi:MAG: glycosyltransferase [Oscillatoriales cyanobacterium C42_A2020_001]|nr:glycosyltransferase [Leptolyngbyaceae cyanobacterium C42_A2020_001]
MSEISPRIAFFIGCFGGGGIERITAHLAHSFVKLGIGIDMVLDKGGSPHLWRMPPETRIIDLKAPRLSMSLPGLVRYLQQERPFAMLSADHYLNEIALLAKRLAGVPTRAIVAEHNQLSKTTRNASKLKGRIAPIAARLLYPWADGIIAVSHGVAEDLAQTASLPRDRIQTIYNPVINSEMLANAKEPVEHPWFASSEIPVILGVGKLEPQKDFPNLIHAFAKVRQSKPARLVILGWGPDRPELEALVKELGLQDEVDLPGYVQNPYAYMARASTFVLSSAWEGLPTVLIEAMALGTPVVSTDCESGPSEILANGKYGYLTPVGDSDALADAILEVLSGNPKPLEPAWLDQFGLETATQRYLEVLGIA